MNLWRLSTAFLLALTGAASTLTGSPDLPAAAAAVRPARHRRRRRRSTTTPTSSRSTRTTSRTSCRPMPERSSVQRRLRRPVGPHGALGGERRRRGRAGRLPRAAGQLAVQAGRAIARRMNAYFGTKDDPATPQDEGRYVARVADGAPAYWGGASCDPAKDHQTNAIIYREDRFDVVTSMTWVPRTAAASGCTTQRTERTETLALDLRDVTAGRALTVASVHWPLDGSYVCATDSWVDATGRVTSLPGSDPDGSDLLLICGDFNHDDFRQSAGGGASPGVVRHGHRDRQRAAGHRLLARRHLRWCRRSETVLGRQLHGVVRADRRGRSAPTPTVSTTACASTFSSPSTGTCRPSRSGTRPR